jgi:cytoskeletal protein RodZ
MFIKIMVVSSILILGALIFAPEIIGLFSNVSSNVESMKENVNNFGIKTTESVENGIDSSVKVVDETSDKINSQINIAKESSEDLSEKISKVNPIKSIDNIFKNETGHESIPETLPTNTESPNTDSPSIEFNYSGSPIYENLSLSMIQQSNGDVLLQYSDSTGNTKSTSVVIRTDEKEIFSGTFFTSNFKTVINDVSRTSYYVDITVEHKDYGTVTSSIFNSGDSIDSEIMGDFIQP